MPQVQSYNIDLSLHTLGWKAFQDLCGTIMSEVMGHPIQQFFSSRDGGRDGAFGGPYTDQKYVVQCKFFSTPSRTIKLSDLSDELAKAARLRKAGLCDHYFVMTNGIATGENVETIEKALKETAAIPTVTVYGADWITQRIRESGRLRALVPRVYGLGDLSQIIDARALSQARDLLSAIKDELGKFVITKSYRQAARAIMDSGFVFLLGEPLCGKSMTAACLSVAALDQNHAEVFKLTRASDLETHWNTEEKRLFWFDDVFGPNQYRRELAAEWVNYFPHLNAAIKGGNRVIFTSRTYIYDEAIRDIKTQAFPLIRDSHVVIRVQDLSLLEKKQILYNHIKLGSQPPAFRAAIKPHLNSVAKNSNFQPEIARRLGNLQFTRSLRFDERSLAQFVDEPKAFLVEIVESLSTANFAALTLLFLNGGQIGSPLSLSEGDRRAIARIGANEADVARALNDLKGDFVSLVLENGEQVWKFKHPTFADAVAEIVARNPEYVDIYLKGAKPAQVLREVVCGAVEVPGARLVVPRSRVGEMRGILAAADQSLRDFFLAVRCDDFFLVEFIQDIDLRTIVPEGHFSATSSTYLLARLHRSQILPEDVRLMFVESARKAAIDSFDFSFYNDDRVRSLLNDAEVSSIVDDFANEGLKSLAAVLESWKEDMDEMEDPESYFDPIREALVVVSEVSGEKYKDLIEGAENQVEETIQEIKDERSAEQEPDWENDYGGGVSVKPDLEVRERDIFDDVDQ